MGCKNKHSFETISRLVKELDLHLSDGTYHTEAGVIDQAPRPTFAVVGKTSTDGKAVAFTYRSGDKTLKNKTYLNSVSLSEAKKMFAEKLNLNQVYF